MDSNYKQAIEGMNFLIAGYLNLTNNRKIYPECNKILDACITAKQALENQRSEADWIVCDDDLFLKCTSCENRILLEEASPYCPECGAEMKSVRKTERGTDDEQ